MKQTETGVTLGELAGAIDASLNGNADTIVYGIATVQEAGEGEVTFLANRKFARYLSDTRASAVIVARGDADACKQATLVVDDAYLAYAKAATLLASVPVPRSGIHPDASVSKKADIHPLAWIGPQAVVEEHASIAAGVHVGPGCFIGRGTRIGVDSHLVANVSLCHHVTIGERVRIFPGAVIGADGFGFARDGESWYKIPQLGSVLVGDDVEIGVNTAIDRGALKDTVIGSGVKLDNHIQIAHNVQIGENTLMAGRCAVAGSTILGKQCAFGGGVSITGHVEVVDGTQITAGSTVLSSIDKPGVYSSGVPLDENAHWRRNYVRFKQLDEMSRRIRKLEQAMDELTRGS